MENNVNPNKVSVPVWFWIAAAAGLLWFLMGAMACFMRVTMTEEFLATWALPLLVVSIVGVLCQTFLCLVYFRCQKPYGGYGDLDAADCDLYQCGVAFSIEAFD